MANQNPQDNLFEQSTMTFGSHLEELRVALFHGVAGLLVGFLLGLTVANQVVKFIQLPLEKALANYYITSDVEKLKKTYGAEMSPEMVKFIRDHRIISDELLIEYSEFERLAGRRREFQDLLDKRPTEKTKPSAGEKEKNPESPAGGDEKPAPAEEKRAAPAEVAELSISSIKQELETLLPLPSLNMLKTRVWRPVKTRITSLNAQEAFLIWLKAAMITGLILACPYIFYHLWNFVAAGLYPHERNYVYIYLPFSIALFLAGAATAFFLVFEPVLDFLFGFNRWMDIDPDPRISEWIGFVLFLPLGFGIAFQLPLVMLFINRLGILTIEMYLEKWRIAILVIFVLSMLLTPADPISMLMMAVPLTLLYFLGIVLCKWMPRGRGLGAPEEVYEP